jgi:hypothetical protein
VCEREREKEREREREKFKKHHTEIVIQIFNTFLMRGKRGTD